MRRMLRKMTCQTVQAAWPRSYEAETRDGLDEPAFKAHAVDSTNSNPIWHPGVCGNLAGTGAI